MFIFVVVGSVTSDDIFLRELKAVYRSAGNTSISISLLGDKYIEIHSLEKYKNNLKGTKLKAFLLKSGNFICTGDQVKMVEGTAIAIYLID